MLRSNKNDSNKYNIDIIFFDVKYIQLPVSFDKIEINIHGQHENISYPTIKDILKYKNNYLYQVITNNELHFIVASFFKVFENELEFNQTSLGMLDPEVRGIEIFSSI